MKKSLLSSEQMKGSLTMVALLAIGATIANIYWRRNFEAEVLRIVEEREKRQIAPCSEGLNRTRTMMEQKPWTATNITSLLQGFFDTFESSFNKMSPEDGSPTDEPAIVKPATTQPVIN